MTTSGRTFLEKWSVGEIPSDPQASITYLQNRLGNLERFLDNLRWRAESIRPDIYNAPNLGGDFSTSSTTAVATGLTATYTPATEVNALAILSADTEITVGAPGTATISFRLNGIGAFLSRATFTGVAGASSRSSIFAMFFTSGFIVNSANTVAVGLAVDNGANTAKIYAATSRLKLLLFPSRFRLP